MENGIMDNEKAHPEEERKKIIKETMLKSLLTTKARQRLSNIRIVKPELAELAEKYVFKIASDLDLQRALTDEELKKILNDIQPPKKDFKMRWI